MWGIQVNEQGGPEVLTWTELPEPEAGAGEIVVEVAAAGLNYIDTYHRTGLYPMDTPFTPGLEGAGTVVAVGAGVVSVAVGDHVAWPTSIGSYAERVKMGAASVVRSGRSRMEV